MWSRFVCWIDQDPLSHACPLPSTWKEVILYAAIVQSILPLYRMGLSWWIRASMGTMGFFIVTIRKHNAIRLLSFLCLYALLTASVAWSVYFRSYRCILASCTLLVATVLGHSIMNESIRIHLILILILVACSLILLISVYSLCLAIRGNGSIAIECAWTMVFLCLSLQGLMLVLAGYGAFIHGILSVLPTACLLVLSVIFYLTITVIRSLRVFLKMNDSCRKGASFTLSMITQLWNSQVRWIQLFPL